MAYTPLAAEINTYNKDRYLTNMWTSMYPYLKEYYTLVTTIKTVSVTDANKFMGDLAGMMKHVMGIHPDFIIPNILANGYNCSTDYDGRQLDFIILNENILRRLLTMLQRSKRLNNK